MNSVIQTYAAHVQARQQQGIKPKPLTEKETIAICELLRTGITTEEGLDLVPLLKEQVPTGRHKAAKPKARLLHDIALGEVTVEGISADEAIELLGFGQIGQAYGIEVLVEFLGTTDLAAKAAEVLKKIPFVGALFAQVVALKDRENVHATAVLQSWALMEWMNSRRGLPQVIKGVVYRLPGEWNTEYFSPASDAANREDTDLHALSMLAGYTERNAVEQIAELKRQTGLQVIMAGDIMLTESSRESSTNNINANIGLPVPGRPATYYGAVVLGQIISPTGWDNLDDNGCLGIQSGAVKGLNMGDVIELHTDTGAIYKDGAQIGDFGYRHNESKQMFAAGSGLDYAKGKITAKLARRALGIPEPEVQKTGRPMSAPQKVVARLAGVEEVVPGNSYDIEAQQGLQDTTGGMTNAAMVLDGTKELGTRLAAVSRCHTGGSPNFKEILRWRAIHEEFGQRGGLMIPQMVIHTMLRLFDLPTVGRFTNDSHGRHKCLSRPAGSKRGAHVLQTGTGPWYVYDTVLVKFTGNISELPEGVTGFDVAAAIPYYAGKAGLLNTDKTNKVNEFANRSLQVKGLEQAPAGWLDRITDWSAEWFTTDCFVNWSLQSWVKEVTASLVTLRSLRTNNAHLPGMDMLDAYIEVMEAWLRDPWIPEDDEGVEYVHTIEIPFAELKPLVTVGSDYHNVVGIDELDESLFALRAYDLGVYSCLTQIEDYLIAPAILKGIGGKKPSILADSMRLVPPAIQWEYWLKHQAPIALNGFAPWDTVMSTHGVVTAEAGRCDGCMGNKGTMGSCGGSGKKADFMETSDGFNASMGTRSSFGREGTGPHWQGNAAFIALCAKLGRAPRIEEYMTEWRANVKPEMLAHHTDWKADYVPHIELGLN